MRVNEGHLAFGCYITGKSQANFSGMPNVERGGEQITGIFRRVPRMMGVRRVRS